MIDHHASIRALLVVVIVVSLVLFAAPKDAQASCYAIMYTEAMSGDTWSSIANHWGMRTSTLKAMNPNVPQKKGNPVVGSQIKIAVWIGCPRGSG